MHVFCLCDLDELAPYADQWDRLSAGVPFRSWAWLSTWWRHYGQDHNAEPGRAKLIEAWRAKLIEAWRAKLDAQPKARLFVLCVFDHTDTLVGLAPWYLECRGPQGSALRMLGSGEVCSEYLSVLCQPGLEYQVTQAVADHLAKNGQAVNRDHRPWDLLELTGCHAHDRVIDQLIRHLAEQGHTVHSRAGPNCWRIELPATWGEYLAALSKSHRKQLRRLQRNMLSTGRAVLHTVERLEELPRAVDLLIDLHQRRRRALEEPGCFASARFTAFHREVIPKLLLAGQLQLHWLELDGTPAAVEYQLAGGGVVYAYQAGVDPQALDHQPGRLVTLATLRRAIEQGYRAFDFLRGDEPYKAHFRARPRRALSVRVVPKRASAQLRHNLWLAGSNVKQWIKGGLRLVSTRGE